MADYYPGPFDSELQAKESGTEAPTTFHNYKNLPYDIKFMIWELALLQPKIVEVETEFDLICTEKSELLLEGKLDIYEMAFSLASDHTIPGLFVDKESRGITLNLSKDLVMSNMNNTFYVRDFEAMAQKYEIYESSSPCLMLAPIGIRHIAINADSFVDQLTPSFGTEAHNTFTSLARNLAAFHSLEKIHLVLNLREDKDIMPKPAQMTFGCSGLAFRAGVTAPLNFMLCSKSRKRVENSMRVADQIKEKMYKQIKEFIGRDPYDLEVKVVQWKRTGSIYSHWDRFQLHNMMGT